MLDGDAQCQSRLHLTKAIKLENTKANGGCILQFKYIPEGELPQGFQQGCTFNSEYLVKRTRSLN
jgi:hypothetical protein